MQNQAITPRVTFSDILNRNQPNALAWVSGYNVFPQLSGLVKFYDTPYGGILVEAEIFGLPDLSQPGSSNFYGFHIHENGDCTADFTRTGNHYNPGNQPHPQHAGDMPPILGNQGYGWLSFYDKRFTVMDIVGKSVVIHSQRDDFSSQPSGDSGSKIGCGVIQLAGNY